MERSVLTHELEDCRNILLAASPALPKREDLATELADADAAQERGYYLPDEDERLREVYARYLEVRAALREVVSRMEPWVDMGEKLSRENQLRVFLIGFTAACFLIRSGLFMIGIAQGRRVVRRKLDEAEPRFDIPKKSFTQIYRLQTSMRRMWKFHAAYQFYLRNKDDLTLLKNDPELSALVDLLIAEEPFMEKRRRNYWNHRIRYRWHSFRRRHRSGFEQTMFRIFELGGRTIAELRDPTTGLRRLPKRAAGVPCSQALAILEPGDIIVTRHRDALSNLFLPGFWPHAAFFVGEQKEGGNVVEARKDGVKLRDLSDTLSVDAFLVLRANLGTDIKNSAASRALCHVDKLYDFAFDFSQSDRLACTAVVYRSWHGLGDVTFSLGEKAGRMCLSAEELISQALDSGHFQIVAFFGPDCEKLSLQEVAQEQFLRYSQKHSNDAERPRKISLSYS
jgi:hypothetical protein